MRKVLLVLLSLLLVLNVSMISVFAEENEETDYPEDTTLETEAVLEEETDEDVVLEELVFETETEEEPETVEQETVVNVEGEEELKDASFTVSMDKANKRIVIESDDEDYITALCSSKTVTVHNPEEWETTTETEGAKVYLTSTEDDSMKIIDAAIDMYVVSNGENKFYKTDARVVQDGNKAYIPYNDDYYYLDGEYNVMIMDVPGYGDYYELDKTVTIDWEFADVPADLKIYQETNGDIVLKTATKAYLRTLAEIHESYKMDEESETTYCDVVVNVIRIEDEYGCKYDFFNDDYNSDILTYKASEGKIVISFKDLSDVLTYPGEYGITIEVAGYKPCLLDEVLFEKYYAEPEYTVTMDTENKCIVIDSDDAELLDALVNRKTVRVFDSNGNIVRSERGAYILLSDENTGRNWLLEPFEEYTLTAKGKEKLTLSKDYYEKVGDSVVIKNDKNELPEGELHFKLYVPGYAYDMYGTDIELDWGYTPYPEDLTTYINEKGDLVITTEDIDYLRTLTQYNAYNEKSSYANRVSIYNEDGENRYYNVTFDKDMNSSTFFYIEGSDEVLVRFDDLYIFETGDYNVEVYAENYKVYSDVVEITEVPKELPEFTITPDYENYRFIIESEDKDFLNSLVSRTVDYRDGKNYVTIYTEDTAVGGDVLFNGGEMYYSFSNADYHTMINGSEEYNSCTELIMEDGVVYADNIYLETMASDDYEVYMHVPGYVNTDYDNPYVFHYDKPLLPTEYLVNFDSNGGEGTMEGQVITADVATLLKANTFTKAGYKFVGWSFNGMTYANKEKVKNLAVPGEEITLKAIWEPVSYTIKYLLDGGSNPNIKFTSYTIETDYELLPAVKAGYIFVNWTDVEGNVVENVLGMSGAQTFKANYVLEEYELTLNTNGGTLAAKAEWPDNITFEGEKNGVRQYSYDITKVVKLPKLEKPGYKFDGWYTNVWNTKTETYVPKKISAIKKGSEDMAVYASFTPVSYSIKYNTSGGKITSLKGTYTDKYHVETAELILPEVTREGYVFAGWYRAYDKKTGVYSNSITTLEELTEVYEKTNLYAAWTPISYKMTFKAEGLSDVTVTVNYGESVKLDDAIFNLPGKAVGKWTYSYTTSKGTSTKTIRGNASVKNLTPNEGETITFTVAKDKNNLEVWNFVNYSVKYEKISGIKYNSKSVKSYKYTEEDDTYVIYNPIKKGYNFVKWAYLDKNQEVQYIVPEDISDAGCAYLPAGIYQDLVMTPVFEDELATYTITYEGNLGSFAEENPNPATYQYSTTSLPLLNPTRSGFAFTGWYINNKKVTSIAKGTTGNLTVEARWNGTKYSVVFKGNGSTSGSMTSQTIECETETALKINEFKRNGYVFAGWNTDPHGAGETYLDGETVLNLLDKAGTVTLYAMWEDAGLSVSKVTRYSNGNVLDTTTYEYDVTGNATRQTFKSSASGTYVGSYTYDNDGALTEWTQTYNGKFSFRMLYEYDENGRKVKETSLDENGDIRYSDTYTYDENGNLVKITYGSQHSEIPSETCYTYDENGNRLTEEVYYSGSLYSTTENRYDDQGRRIYWGTTYNREENNNTSYNRVTYDGNVETTYYCDGRNDEIVRSVITYDAKGREIRSEWHDFRTGELSSTRETSYEDDGKICSSLYDASGKLKQKSEKTVFEDGGYVIYYFDANGKKTSGECSDIRNSYKTWDYDKYGNEVITHEEVRVFTNTPVSKNSAENLPYMFLK